jgi:hypothetical protein
LTTALAYDLTSDVPIRAAGEERDAASELAVIWAVVQLGESMPATIEDRAALEDARARLLDLARALGADENGLKRLLQDRYEGCADTHDGPPRRWLRSPAS